MADIDPDTIVRYLEKRGVKSRVVAQRVLNYLGKSAGSPFSEVVIQSIIRVNAGDDEFASIGDIYDNQTYQQTAGSKERTYEDVYGDNDWSLAAQDPQVRQALDEAFGGVDGRAGTETGLTETSLVIALGRSRAVPNQKSIFEKGRTMSAAQGSMSEIADEDTKGIRGVADFESILDPIA